jgi:hypothetical protein
MPISHLLGAAEFGPDQIARMKIAYEEAVKALGLNDQQHELKETVAKQVIAIAKTGEFDPATMAKLALKALGMPDVA